MLFSRRNSLPQTKRQHSCYRRHRFLNGAYRFLSWMPFYRFWASIFVVSSVANALLAILQFMDIEDGQKLEYVPVAFHGTVLAIWQHRFTFAIVLIVATGGSAVLSGIAALLRQFQVPNLDIIKRALEDLVKQHFDNRSTDCIYRATLFREYSCLFCGRWLGIVQRSGDVLPSRRTVFSVDPQNRNRCTGIAGECWWRAKAQHQSRIYDVLTLHTDDTTNNLSYLDAGFLDGREFNSISNPSVFFHAIEVRVNGKVWGVLVLDSSDSTVQLKQETKNNKHIMAMDRAVTYITWLLE